MRTYAIVAGLGAVLVLGALAGGAGAQTEPLDQMSEELIGGKVFGLDGAEIGEVSAVKLGADGQIEEIHMTTERPFGFGTRVVILPRGSFIALRGAVVLDRSWFEIPLPPGN